MSLRWIHDVFGNSVAIATFDERARHAVVHLDLHASSTIRRKSSR